MASWLRLKRECEPRQPGRLADTLSGLTAPDWANCEADTFRARFLEREVATQLCKLRSGATLGISLRVAESSNR